MSGAARPRVLHVVSHLDLGGAEEVAISLAGGLGGEYATEFFAVGGVANTAVGRAMHARLSALGVPVHSGTPLTMKRGGLPHAGVRLAALLRRTRPDLVHLHTEIPETTYALAALAGGPRPQVIRTVHNATVWPAWGRIGGWVERRLTGVSAVAVSRDSLSGLNGFRARHGLPALPAAQSHVVYNGVSLAAPSPDQPPFAPDGAVRILFAGRLEPQKGADLLPTILTRACALTDRAARVTILGDGSLAPDLRRWAAEARLPWPVTLEPPRAGLSGTLSGYDVVLMPSRFEGFGLIAAEALLAGTPVIATDIAGLRETLPPGYPLLAPAEDTGEIARRLAGVVDDPARFRALAQGLSGGVAARFGLPRMLAGYRQVYRGLLGAGADRAVTAATVQGGPA
jgi:glycosyltransferase involved in cell wall biosynthesis